MSRRWLLGFVVAVLGRAELTRDQKLADFRALADVVATRYAPYEWKRDALNYDALNLVPWLDRVGRSKDDLDYLEICTEYIAALRDGHTYFGLPSTFSATLGFTVDLYEGKLLIDSINRGWLPALIFAAEIGDELVSIDGKPAGEIMQGLVKFAGEGNPRTALRQAASMLTSRNQAFLPRAHELPDTSAVAVRRASGETATFNLDWTKTGVPLLALPSAPPIRTASAIRTPAAEEDQIRPRGARGRSWWLHAERPFTVGVGVRDPLFALPERFDYRIGRAPSDRIISGSISVDGLKIAYVRLATFLNSRAAEQVQNEIRYYRDNSDGLIVDLLRNPGGIVCQAEDLVSFLAPDGFRVFTGEIRVNWSDLLGLYDERDFYKRVNAPADLIAEVEMLIQEFEDAIRTGRPRTHAVPLCGIQQERGPAKDRVTGEVVAYGKPVIILQDEFNASAAEIFAALLQDADRALVIGARSAGAGGAAGLAAAGVYSEAELGITVLLGFRSKEISSPGLPPAALIENVGIQADSTLEYMTRDNLVGKGKPYLDKVMEKAVEYIRSKQ